MPDSREVEGELLTGETKDARNCSQGAHGSHLTRQSHCVGTTLAAGAQLSATPP
jgi:hypothetical protein